MRKIFGAVSLIVLGFAVSPCQGEVAHATGAVAPAAIYDPVQRCLDLVQLSLAGKIAPARPVTSHPVQNPPKDLPIQCLAENLKEIKSALMPWVVFNSIRRSPRLEPTVRKSPANIITEE